MDAKWFENAAKRTASFVRHGEFEETSSIWSKTKPAFMVLQRNKCVFCERQFGNPEYGTIEFDIEHFRPKSSVMEWPDPGRHPGLSYAFPTGVASDAGHYWLAYDLLNYAASCKVCNTRFKANFFSVAGTRDKATDPPAALGSEKPFLCYPIGDLDDDPETLVTFIVTTAVPAASRGYKHRRGRIIIDFFGLNQREQLHRERARMIALCGHSLLTLAAGRGGADDRAVLARVNASDLPHAGCLRAFHRLSMAHHATARRAFGLCRDHAFTKAGTAPPDL